MNNLRKIIIFSLVIGLCFLASMAGNKQTLSAEANPVTLSVWSFSDELQKIIDRFESENPGVFVELTIIPYQDYVEKMKLVLKSGEHVPDVFMAESGNMGNFIDSGYWDDLSAAPYNADVSDMYRFMVQGGTDSNGKLRALSWQTWIGGFFYRRSMAKQYFGTDDPEKIGEMLATEEKFIAAGLRLKEKSNGKLKLIPGWQEYMHYALAMRKKPFVTKDDRFVLDDAVVRLFAVAKVLHEQGIAAHYRMWSPEWFDGMKQDSDIFGYSLPLWGLKYVLKPNASDSSGDWGVCKGPASYFWGGEWLGINAKSENKRAAWEFIRFATLNRETLEWWANDTGVVVNSKTVINKLKTKITDDYLNGQEYFRYFAAEAPKIDGTLLTEYDGEIIYTILANTINEYLEGTVSQKDAIADFVRNVRKRFPELIME
ncbi:MAG: carbohydrate ABC transporter substrate-binding protein [Spirochaetales bacterium]|nr:carbohydrate ABC transporter substrate-binding protein [Spirochaetales bacterium]